MVSRFDMKETIGALIISVDGLELTSEDKEILNHPLVGGVILFARNYASKRQLTALCQDIRRSRKHPALIMVDQEGGRVQRFKGDFTTLPPMGRFGELFTANPALACREAAECGALMASELISAGVDLSLAPVLDVNRNLNTVIGDRAFHTDAETVTQLAIAFMRGMKQAGMPSVGKHFPGHGSVTVDSHIGLPVDQRTLADIAASDLEPFVGLIKAGIPAIMAAHILFPAVDDKPVGFSARWLKDILRGQLGFEGVIISDDLNMEGANISTNYADRVAAAKEAGCDVLLLCNQRPGVIQALDRLPWQAYQLNKRQWSALLPNQFAHQAG